MNGKFKLFFLAIKSLFTYHFKHNDTLSYQYKNKDFLISLCFLFFFTLSLITFIFFNVTPENIPFIFIVFAIITMILFVQSLDNERLTLKNFIYMSFRSFLDLKSKDISENFKTLHHHFSKNNQENTLEKVYEEVSKNYTSEEENSCFLDFYQTIFHPKFSDIKSSIVQDENIPTYSELKNSELTLETSKEQDIVFFDKEKEKQEINKK